MPATPTQPASVGQDSANPEVCPKSVSGIIVDIDDLMGIAPAATTGVAGATTTADAATDANNVGELEGKSKATASVDVEQGAVEESMKKLDNADADATESRWCCLRTRRRRIGSAVCSLCCFLLALAVVIIIPVGLSNDFWVKDPDWKVTKLELTNMMGLQILIGAFQPGGLKAYENKSMPVLHFKADVDVTNPNSLGGETGRGEFKVFFKGLELGRGWAMPKEVPANSNVTIEAGCDVQLFPKLAEELSATVMKSNFMITVQVVGHTTVKALLGYKMTAGVTCDVDSLVTDILGPNPASMIKAKRCTYSYDFI
eukprot:TRINITY_DN835_c0_g1_i3.p1 TRINITY_DN835_c0_g1~~TRINITY_DN835_c0_g1_i3.p1  ORF type:complete len:314 (+),score=59.61 TRINITY_DN835_c0_g1_i3:175-1116(+)